LVPHSWLLEGPLSSARSGRLVTGLGGIFVHRFLVSPLVRPSSFRWTARFVTGCGDTGLNGFSTSPLTCLWSPPGDIDLPLSLLSSSFPFDTGPLIRSGGPGLLLTFSGFIRGPFVTLPLLGTPPFSGIVLGLTFGPGIGTNLFLPIRVLVGGGGFRIALIFVTLYLCSMFPLFLTIPLSKAATIRYLLRIVA